MNLKIKIAEYNQQVAELKEKLAQAKDAGQADLVRIFTERLHDVASARYAIKSLYIETISTTFDISLEQMIMRVDSHIDISKIADEYDVYVVAKLKT